MVKDNIDRFMKNSSIHVANFNRNLRNAKSKVLIDFICSDLLGIMVVTNKVSLNSDILTIEKYVKNLENIDSIVIAQGCGQTLGLGLVDKNRTVVIISLQRTKG